MNELGQGVIIFLAGFGSSVLLTVLGYFFTRFSAKHYRGSPEEWQDIWTSVHEGLRDSAAEMDTMVARAKEHDTYTAEQHERVMASLEEAQRQLDDVRKTAEENLS